MASPGKRKRRKRESKVFPTGEDDADAAAVVCWSRLNWTGLLRVRSRACTALSALWKCCTPAAIPQRGDPLLSFLNATRQKAPTMEVVAVWACSQLSSVDASQLLVSQSVFSAKLDGEAVKWVKEEEEEEEEEEERTLVKERDRDKTQSIKASKQTNRQKASATNKSRQEKEKEKEKDKKCKSNTQCVQLLRSLAKPRRRKREWDRKEENGNEERRGDKHWRENKTHTKFTFTFTFCLQSVSQCLRFSLLRFCSLNELD